MCQAQYGLDDVYTSPKLWQQLCQVGMTVPTHKRQVRITLEARLVMVELGAQSGLSCSSSIKIPQPIWEQFLAAASVTCPLLNSIELPGAGSFGAPSAAVEKVAGELFLAMTK